MRRRIAIIPERESFKYRLPAAVAKATAPLQQAQPSRVAPADMPNQLGKQRRACPATERATCRMFRFLQVADYLAVFTFSANRIWMAYLAAREVLLGLAELPLLLPPSPVCWPWSIRKLEIARAMPATSYTPWEPINRQRTAIRVSVLPRAAFSTT